MAIKTWDTRVSPPRLPISTVESPWLNTAARTSSITANPVPEARGPIVTAYAQTRVQLIRIFDVYSQLCTTKSDLILSSNLQATPFGRPELLLDPW